MRTIGLNNGIAPIVAVAMVFTATAFAGTMNRQSFVSVTGNDTNPCTSALPCATINHALTVTNAGGVVTLATSGSYAPATLSQPVSLNAPASVDASITTTAGNALTVSTTGNVSINGITLRGGAEGADGIMVTQVGVLRLNNVTVQNFTETGVEFDAAGGEMVMYNSQSNDNGHDGLRVNGNGAHVYVEGSAFDRNTFAGGDSVDGKLTISDSNAHFNDIGFYANGGSVTLYNARSIFNTTGLQVSSNGHMHFANCLVSDNTTGWNVAAGGVLSGSEPGTTLFAPGQTPNSGTMSAPVNLR